MSAANTGASGADLWQPKVNPWIIAGAVSLAAFMEVLDTSIANVALPHIAGGLAASNDESTWVLTSYLVSNAIVLPLRWLGWLQRLGGSASLDLHLCFLQSVPFSVGIGNLQPRVSSPVPSHARRVWRRLAADGAVYPGR